jgi:2-desacetyl-2-hydroxyethyl bacteriochlorophyllide A dehydrogenase
LEKTKGGERGETMYGAVFHGVGKNVTVERVPKPVVRKPDDVLIRVRACGVCGTDLAILEGRHPASSPVILGHEYAGEVVDLGAGIKNLKKGDRVVVDPNIKCGTCLSCRSGRQNLCENYTTLGIYLNGGFAEYNVAPYSTVYRLPADMDWKDAALVEPVACAINGVRKSRMKPGETVVVFGAGPMGLIWLALAKHSGATSLVSVEISENRREVARRIGADTVLDPNKQSPSELIKKMTGERGADVVVDAVGNPKIVSEALKMIGAGGRVMLFGTNPMSAEVPINPYNIMHEEKEIIGSYIANYTFIPAIETMYRKVVPSDILFTHEFPLNEISKAFETHKRGESIKILIKPTK